LEDAMLETRELESLEPVVLAHGRGEGTPRRARLEPTPLLRALRSAGTEHVYGDSADVEELAGVLRVAGDGAGPSLRAEVDGNTANQPLVARALARVLDDGDPRSWARDLLRAAPDLPREALHELLYTILCCRLGNGILRAFAAGRRFEVSLQLHMGLSADPEGARRVGHWIHRLVPGAFVKVPFAPDSPDCFLVARDLEAEGVPVNFTSTFSARQVVAAALLAGASRTNVFMGRLNQGLHAALLGEHVCLEAQRALRSLRRETGVGSRLIVASLREWQSLARLAGCDVFTAPCGVLADFLAQREVPPEAIADQLETSYQDRLGVAPEVAAELGAERIARLYRVEPELVEFLREYRRTREYAQLRDGEALFKRLDRAGFADLFHHPTAEERAEARRSKLPDLGGQLRHRLSLDTHYSLLANEDFAHAQEQIDAEVARRLVALR
jgi:transaldolase